MSSSDLQSVVRDLAKTVASLVTKISEQTVVIKSQTKKLEDQKQLIEKNFAVINDQKRVIENLATKVGELLAATGSAKKGIVATSAASISLSATGTVAGGGSAEPTARARRAAHRIENKGAATLGDSTRLGNNVASNDKGEDGPSNQPPVLSEWRTVNRKKISTERQAKIVNTGGNTQISSIQAIETKKFLHVWSLHPDTASEAIAKHVEDVCGSKDVKVEKLVPKSKRDYSSFMIGVPESLFEKINCVECWPLNAKFNNWIWFRNKQQSTDRENREN